MTKWLFVVAIILVLSFNAFAVNITATATATVTESVTIKTSEDGGVAEPEVNGNWDDAGVFHVE